MQLTYASGLTNEITEKQLTTYTTVVKGLRACLNVEQALAFSKLNVAADISHYFDDEQIENTLQFIAEFLSTADQNLAVKINEAERSKLCREAADLAK